MCSSLKVSRSAPLAKWVRCLWGAAGLGGPEQVLRSTHTHNIQVHTAHLPVIHHAAATTKQDDPKLFSFKRIYHSFVLCHTRCCSSSSSQLTTPSKEKQRGGNDRSFSVMFAKYWHLDKLRPRCERFPGSPVSMLRECVLDFHAERLDFLSGCTFYLSEGPSDWKVKMTAVTSV